MLKQLSRIWPAALAALALSTSAHATLIEYDAMNLGGTTFEFRYDVTNDTLGFDIEEFTIFYDLSLYANISIVGSPVDWDPLVIQPDPGIPDDGFADWLALSFGIGPAETLGGFIVTADYFGPGTPDSQPFTIVDPFTFDTLDSGLAVAREGPPPPPTSVPEAPATVLLLSGLLAVALSRRRRLLLAMTSGTQRLSRTM